MLPPPSGHVRPHQGLQVPYRGVALTGVGPAGSTDRTGSVRFDGRYRNTLCDALLPAVAYNSQDNEYLVVWQGRVAPSGELEIFRQRITAGTGLEIGHEDLQISEMGSPGDTAYGAFAPAVATSDRPGEYLVVWDGDHDEDGLVDQEQEIFDARVWSHLFSSGFERGSTAPWSQTTP